MLLPETSHRRGLRLYRARHEPLQRELWAHAVASANEAPSPVVATFVTSLNETIDLDAKRWNAMRWHLPSAVWILVLVAASVGCYATDFHAGRTGARPRSPIYPAGTRHMIIGLIADLDRSRFGVSGSANSPWST